MAAHNLEADDREGTPDLLYSHDWDFGYVMSFVMKTEPLYFGQ